MMRASAAESLHAFTLSAPARAAGARLHDIEENRMLMGTERQVTPLQRKAGKRGNGLAKTTGWRFECRTSGATPRRRIGETNETTRGLGD
jgi:hypothetical protein